MRVDIGNCGHPTTRVAGGRERACSRRESETGRAGVRRARLHWLSLESGSLLRQQWRRQEMRARGSIDATVAATACAVLALVLGRAQAETCDHTAFYAADELASVHDIDLRMPSCSKPYCKEGDPGYTGSFNELVDNQGNRHFGELEAEIVVNGIPHAGGKVQVHGGTPQRGSKTEDDAVTPGSDCSIGGLRQSNPSLPGCKAGLRLNFAKHSPLNTSRPVWSFPRALQTCKNPDKFVLRNEYADYHLMVRNKLTQDLISKTGMPALRVEFARLHVNGDYFGLYTLEEHVDDDFLKCRGLPHDDAALYKAYPDKALVSPTPHHASWFDCPGRPEECTVGFEMKLPECHGCSGEMFSDTDPGSCGVGDGGCLGGWLKSGYKDPTNPDCPTNCSAPTHLAGLFGAINKEDTTLSDLSLTLNVTSYMLWQIVATFVQNDDTGWHNYYLYKPSLDERQQPSPWHVVNYDSDNAWGQSPWHPRQFDNGMCNCEQVAMLDHSDYYDFRPFLLYKFPMFRFSFLMYVLLTLMSCWVECQHWAPYKAQRSQLVTPLAPISAEPTAVVVTVPEGLSSGQQMIVDIPGTGQQTQVTIPEGLASGQQFRVELAHPASTQAASPPQNARWILPPAVSIVCVKDWRQWEAVSTVWGLPRPLVNRGHGSTEVEQDGSTDDSSLNPVHSSGDSVQQTFAEAESTLNVHAGPYSPAERAQLAYKWLCERSYEYPSRASCISVLFSLLFANNVGLLNMALGVWIYWHSWNVCCCGPLLRCRDGQQTRKLMRAPTTKCCTNADGTAGCSCCCFMYAVIVFGFGYAIAEDFGWRQGNCYRDCEMTGFDMMGFINAIGAFLYFVPTMHRNAMESVLEDLALPQYYGLYSDFADAGFTQPCVLQTAVEQISGVTGILRDPLVSELTHWCMDGVCDRGGDPRSFAAEIVAGEVQYMKNWIERKGTRLRSSLQERCDSDGACLRGFTCLTPFAHPCHTEETCAQGSLTASCVELERDGCGCVEGQGWSKHANACVMGASTSRTEAEKCISRQGQG